jgi:endonuclease/exonuclease/phosphatase family metal-dependent hydrolase
VHLLSVHLKSGCSHEALNSPSKACAQLASQLPALEAWVDGKARAGERFAILGDFNRNLLGERGPARTGSGAAVRMWPELDDGDPPEADLVNAAEHAPFRNCWAGQGYAAYIDYIVLSRSLGIALVPGSFERVTYSAGDVRRTRLSDHCPVAARLRLR